MKPVEERPAPPMGVLGAGPFGRALARAAHRAGHPVRLWSRRRHDPPAPGIEVSSRLEWLAEADLILLAVPSPHVETAAERLAPHLQGHHLLVHVSRGLLGERLETIGAMLARRTAARRIGALAGPLSAAAMDTGAPSAAVLGTPFPEVAEAVRLALASHALRIEVTTDRCGVEVAAALVGAMALAVGYVQGSGLGPAPLSALLSQALGEARTLGRALGGKPSTFDGLAGVGDLLAAALGDDRPEIRIGRALAHGEELEAAARAAGGHVEGVRLVSRLASFAREQGLQAPLTEALAEAVSGRRTGWRALTAALEAG